MRRLLERLGLRRRRRYVHLVLELDATQAIDQLGRALLQLELAAQVLSARGQLTEHQREWQDLQP